VVDSAGFAAAACLLCDVAFVQGGLVGLIAMVVLLLIDPWRRMFIPGWWTEGLAFDFLSLIVWLLSNGKRHSPTRCNIAAGLAVGLLCLDRSMFVLLIPALCILLAIASSRAQGSLGQTGAGDNGDISVDSDAVVDPQRGDFGPAFAAGDAGRSQSAG